VTELLDEPRPSLAADEAERDRKLDHRKSWRPRVRDAFAALVAAGLSMLTAWHVLGLDRATLSQRWLDGGPDAVLHYGISKSALERFPYLPNRNLGFPHAQDLFFAPLFDPVSASEVRLLGLISSDANTVLSLYQLVGFALVAVTAYLFFRLLGISWALAVLFSYAFSVLPWHYLQLHGHPFLASYWAVPLIGVLALVVGGRATDPFVDMSARRSAAAVVVVAVLIGLSQSYFYVFAAVVLGTLFLVRVLSVLLGRVPWTDLVRPALALGTLALTVLVQLVVLSRGRGELLERYYASRTWTESELYGGKVTALLMPWPGTGFPGMGHVREVYDAITLVRVGEGPWGSMLASIGTVLGVGFVCARAMSRQGATAASEDDEPAAARLWLTSAAIVVALLFFVTGGLGAVFAAVVSPEVRAWSRISVLIALLALGVVALLVQRLLSVPRFRAIGMLLALSLVPLVLVDQVTRADTVSATQPIDDSSVRSYVRQAEQILDGGCAVIQLPLHDFPEAGPVERLGDFDHFLPYLYSADLRWSYGSVSGTNSGQFWTVVDKQPVTQLVELGVSLGACAISVDRFGLAADSTLEGDLSSLPDVERGVQSADQRYALYLLPQGSDLPS